MSGSDARSNQHPTAQQHNGFTQMNLELFPELATDFTVKSLNPETARTQFNRRFTRRCEAEAQAEDWAMTQGAAYVMHGAKMTAFRRSRGNVRQVNVGTFNIEQPTSNVEGVAA